MPTFGNKVVEMRLDGPVGEIQPLADLLIRETLGVRVGEEPLHVLRRHRERPAPPGTWRPRRSV
jgi:hypothetical protein